MIAALRNWLLLTLSFFGAAVAWESISISGWMNFWSRQCYFHDGSLACNYGAIAIAAVFAALTLFAIGYWLFVRKLQICSWWQLVFGVVIFAALVIFSDWLLFNANSRENPWVFIDNLFNYSRGDLISAAIAAAAIVLLNKFTVARRPK